MPLPGFQYLPARLRSILIMQLPLGVFARAADRAEAERITDGEIRLEKLFKLTNRSSQSVPAGRIRRPTHAMHYGRPRGPQPVTCNLNSENLLGVVG